MERKQWYCYVAGVWPKRAAPACLVLPIGSLCVELAFLDVVGDAICDKVLDREPSLHCPPHRSAVQQPDMSDALASRALLLVATAPASNKEKKPSLTRVSGRPKDLMHWRSVTVPFRCGRNGCVPRLSNGASIRLSKWASIRYLLTLFSTHSRMRNIFCRYL